MGASSSRELEVLNELRRAEIAGADPNGIKHSPEARQLFGVSGMIWLLLAASILFLSGVRTYVQRHEERALSKALSIISNGASLEVETVDSPIRADRLCLGWQEVGGVDHYLLSLHSADHGMVFDHLRVWETTWFPSDDLIAVMKPGKYAWEVEALGPGGRVIAKSSPASFEIQR